jgi:GT2 family glycosyltransferase
MGAEIEPMSFLLKDIDLCRPLEEIAIPTDRSGLGLLLRYGRRPIAFVMLPLQPGASLSAEEIRETASRASARKLLQEKLREELSVAADDSDQKSLTVAVCTKGRPEMLARCLEALRRTRRSEEASLGELVSLEPQRYEILVVDNAPTDDRNLDVAGGIPGVRYVREPLPGLDIARNLAIAEARGELIAFVDDDVVVDEWWLDGLCCALADNPDAAGVTGLVLPYALETPAQILFESRGGFGRGFEPIHYGQVLPGKPLYPCGAGIFGAGANMAFRREVLTSLGGFDEALDTGAALPGGGDLDIFYRLIRAGHTLVYEPRFAAFHEHRQDLDGLRRQYVSWGRGFAAFAVKSYRADPSQRAQFRRLAVWWCGYQLRELLRSLGRRDMTLARMVLAEVVGGFIGILGEYDRSSRRIAKLRSRAA